jgi:predicted component of type VI protein secretion system
MPAQLVALSEGPSILLDKPILLLGRHPECDIQIDSRKISRRHCCIAQVGDHLVVRDLGSTNGIRINGVRILEGRLKGGDELTIGSHRYQVRWDMGSQKSSADQPGPGSQYTAPIADPAADDELESCDEPIPLGEPNGSRRAPPHGGKAPGLGGEPVARAGPPLGINPVLPEHLELAPASDSLPPHPAPPGV